MLEYSEKFNVNFTIFIERNLSELKVIQILDNGDYNEKYNQRIN